MSTLTVSNIKKTGETVSRDVSGVAAAWVNFNGTGTVVILDSFGVTSLTDVAVGQYTSNLTNNMATANYASTTGSTRSTSVSATRAASGQHATSSCLLHNRNMNSNTDSDDDQLSLVVLGDLA